MKCLLKAPTLCNPKSLPAPNLTFAPPPLAHNNHVLEFSLCESFDRVNVLVLLACRLLGICYWRLDRWSDAERAFAESLRIFKFVHHSGHFMLNMGKN